MTVRLPRRFKTSLGAALEAGIAYLTSDTHEIVVGTGAGRIVIAAGGAGITDGDKGDITVSASGATWTIDASAVTYAKFQNLDACSILGRSANSAGVGASIPATSNGHYLRRLADVVGFGALRAQDLTGTMVQAYLGTNQSLTQSVWNTIQLDTETEDNLGEFDTTTYTFTPAETGVYLVDFFATIGGASGRIISAIWQGTSAEVRRLADGTDTLTGSMCLVELSASTGYTFRVFPLDAGTEANAGASQTALFIRRLY